MPLYFNVVVNNERYESEIGDDIQGNSFCDVKWQPENILSLIVCIF